MRTELDCDYDNGNISVVICDIITWNPWLSSFLVSEKPLSRNCTGMREALNKRGKVLSTTEELDTHDKI